jgi:SNF2 family DNA or RNA helicase
MKSADYLEIPEKLFISHEVKLPDKVKEQYRRLEKEMLLPFADGDIDAGTAGILVNKLLQLCGGSIYDENGGVKNFHDEKLKKLEQLVEEANGKPVIVFYAFKHERARILARFTEAVDVKEPGAVERWNAGKIPILLAHPASAGHGLNLQYGGRIAIWFNLSWSLELYQQANKRLHRIGQTETVLIHHIVVRGGVDSRILNCVLTVKERTQNALIDALKAKIQEVLS